ncbi:MAG: hypothetical protein H7Y07_01650 [Pyrinomonadaceae bacterium]|nr:hypothetical protein [Sphingobacteriaceae bacterium]
MNRSNRYLLLLYLAVILTNLNCRKTKFDCHLALPSFATDTHIYLLFIDKYGKLQRNQANVVPVKIYAENNPYITAKSETYVHPIDSNQTVTVNIGNFVQHAEVRSQEICKTMYLDIGTDRDTLDCCYIIRDTDCGGSIVETLTLKHNGKLLQKSENPYSFEYNIFK